MLFILQVESLFGRKPEKYMMRLINDALVDMSSKKRAYKRHKKFNLVEYGLSDTKAGKHYLKAMEKKY